MIENITVLISGKMRSGKDKSCELLLDMLSESYGFKRLALATEVKRIAAIKKGVPVEEFDNPETKHLHRKDAIDVGTIGRLIDPDTWVNKIKPEVSTCSSILTDVRFENELNRFKELNTETHKVITVRVFADEDVRIKRGAQPEFFNDESETGLDNVTNSEFDFVFSNNTDDVTLLQQKVEKLAEYIRSLLIHKEDNADILEVLSNPAI